MNQNRQRALGQSNNGDWTIRIPRKRSWIVLLIGALFVFMALGADSCASQNANSSEADKVNQQQDVYAKDQPVPFFNFSEERDVLNQIYKARMGAVNTYSVAYSFGRPIWACPSIGYPIPYTTQLTNPQAVSHDTGASWGVVLPQAEPNGLYTGTTTSTWVLCVRKLAGGGTEVDPVYVEQEVIAFSYPVNVDFSTGQITDPGNPGVSITIRTTKPSGASSTPTPNK